MAPSASAPRGSSAYPSGDASPRRVELSSVLPGSVDAGLPSADQLSVHQKAPAFSFGGRTKPKLPAETPGAGSYEVTRLDDVLARYGRSPKFSFGAATRREPRRPRQPGPGAYTVASTVGRTGPSCSCTPRREAARTAYRQKSPGPGSHEVPSSIGGKGAKLSRSARRMDDGPLSRKTPGPGAYESHRDGAVRPRSTPRWGFGTSMQRPKAVVDISDSTPGPGAYRHFSQLKGPQFSMRANTANAKESSEL